MHHAIQAFDSQAVLTFDSEAEVIEAATRCGDRAAAIAALQAFSPRALASGTHGALGMLARCRALLAGDDHAEAEYTLAIEQLQQCRIVPQLARSHLLYGEWLRRQRRRRDARDHLRTACQMFDTLGMEAFATGPGPNCAPPASGPASAAWRHRTCSPRKRRRLPPGQ